MGFRDDQLDLLTLCAIPKIRWDVVARQAGKPDGLARLLRGELSERSQAAAVTAMAIRDADWAAARTRVDAELAAIPADPPVGFTTVLDEDYPANLRVIFNAPPFLFYRGTLHPSDAFSVAVVGTRHPSPDGLSGAGDIASGLVREGVTVLSGLARGIDTAAHRAALDDDSGRTIAVIGTGILRTYPQENADLAEQIVGRGALVSQFWPTAPPSDYNFPRRNIVTSGMGQGTVVVEASGTSGARNQARRALDHGKLVFLIRGLVTHQKWAQAAIERGAIEVSDVREIVSRLRSPEQIERLTDMRRQMVLDLA